MCVCNFEREEKGTSNMQRETAKDKDTCTHTHTQTNIYGVEKREKIQDYKREFFSLLSQACMCGVCVCV